MKVRPIAAHELDAFAQTSKNPDFNQRFKIRLERALKRGDTAVSQCFVLEEDGQWRGRLQFNGAGKLKLAHFEVPQRLQFRPLEEVGRSVFVETIRRAWEGSLDMDDQEHSGPDSSRQEQLNSWRYRLELATSIKKDDQPCT